MEMEAGQQEGCACKSGAGHEEHGHLHSHEHKHGDHVVASKAESQVQVEKIDKNIIENINNIRPELPADIEATSAVNPVLAPYRRTMEEIEKMPIIEKTMTVCPECKLIVNGTIYKDGENVMIRKFCPEHKWSIEKYWEDYDMYMKMRRYNYFGRGFDNPNFITETHGRELPVRLRDVREAQVPHGSS